MFKSIIKFLKSEITIERDCTCGQQKDGICTVPIELTRTGVRQDSAKLLQCGKVKKQQEACSRIFKNQKK